MTDRELVWQSFGLERRKTASLAFWRSEFCKGEHTVALHLLAKHLKARAVFVSRLSDEKKALHLSGLRSLPPDIWDSVMLGYHLETQRPMLRLFLDSLGIPNDNGYIEDVDKLQQPSADVLRQGVQAILAKYSPENVVPYLTALVFQDEELWQNLPELLHGIRQELIVGAI